MTIEQAMDAFLLGYWSARTRGNYTFILGGWFAWCADHDKDPTRDIDPRALEVWIAEL